MRPLALSRVTALAISAAITLGMAGPAIADEHHPSRTSAVTSQAPLPDAAALLTQAEALDDMGVVTTPVTELVTAALKADDGQLPAADAEALKTKITTALDAVKDTAPAPLPETPAAAGGGRAAKAAPADIVTDALATVEKAVAGLLAAVTSGNATGVVPQVTATLTSLVNLVVATVLGSGLPAPDLAGLPTLPTLPVEVPELPVDPPVELPVDPPVELPVAPPVAAPELPVKPPLPVR
ncbi:hypothetical protein ACGFYP_19285 [Streptomyces sp. NPDC048370]|uniref:hypothetical protein n=1 Tax=Streptomyces sp. NPDC048370 TaxID=3365540 RepID=UPI003715EE6C